MTEEQPICDIGSDCGGCPDCGGPPDPNDPGYSTPRTLPQNRTGEPGITLGSRNFNWSTPLVSLPGRASFDFNLTLTYNSLVWVYDNGQLKFNPDDGFPGPGFRLGFPIVQHRFQNSNTGFWSYLMITPSGGRVELRQVGSSNLYESYDGSYAQLTDDGAGGLVVVTGDGTRSSFTDTGSNYVCTQIKDRNGNFVSVGYSGTVPVSATDTVGRVISFNYMNGFLSSITQGGHTWASFNYNSIFFSYNFPGLQVNAPPNNSLLAVPTQVNMDDGSSYQFTYNTWGQISQVTNVASDASTIAYTSYNLPADASSPQSDCPRFTEQHEFARDWNNGAEAVTQLGVDSDGGQVMITPDGTRYKELENTSGFANGLPSLEEWWSGGVRQKWVTYSWTQDNTSLPYAVNPRLVDSTITDVNGNQKRTSINYTSFTMPSGSSCSLPLDMIEYAADAVTPLRRAHTDYNLDGTYLGRNIIGLSSSTSVYDGGGTLFARTDYHYDESALQDLGTITQHDGAYDGGFVQGRANVTSTTRFNVNDLSQTTTSSTTYNTAGSVISMTDAAGHTTTVGYADSNSGNSFAYPTSVTNADGGVATSQYDYDLGLMTQIQAPPPQGFSQGPAMTRQYDAAGRLSQITNTVNGAYTRFVYSPSRMWIEQFATVQDGAGEAFSIQVFDGAGRVRAAAHDHPTGTSGSTPYSGAFTVYDNMGRVARQSNAAETNSSVEISAQWVATGDDGTTGWLYTTQSYDWKGRPTVTTNTDGTQQVLTYGGCGCAGGEVTTTRDEAGRQRRATADTLGRLGSVEELAWDGSVYSTTTYGYDTLDHLTSINQQGQVRSFGFDGYGRLQTRTTPEQGVTTYSYFADDNIQTVTDARGASSTFTHNGRHLVTAINYGVPAGVAATSNVSFSYDAAGNRTSMTDGLGSVSYAYDQLSRLTSETRTFTGFNPLTLNYSYNLSGELTSVTNPWGAQVGYAYDKIGEMTGVSGSGYAGVSTYSSGITYRAFGAIKSLTYGNGLTLSTAYDNRLRLTTLAVSNVQAFNYAYDYFNEHTGRVTYAQNVNDSSLDRSYQYDHLGQLVVSHSGAEARAHAFSGQWGTMDGPYSLGFDYDKWGNMTHRYGWGGEVQGGGADQTSHLYYSYTNNRRDGFTYDAAGNLIYDSQSFTYDATGQQTSASSSFYNLTQDYDGDGLRGIKNDNGTVTYYLRSTMLGGQAVAEMDQYANWTRGYVYQGQSLLAIQQSGVDWVHEDPVTKSKRVTDNMGNVVSASELDPWGADTSRSWSQYFQPKRFTSYDRDGNGSDEAMFRRYNRWHSRFDQPDPANDSYDLSDPQSLNRYAYVQNDPVNSVDPNGLDGDCGSWAEDPATGDWVWIPCSTNTVTVSAGGWDDMSDYLPSWTDDNFFMLIELMGGDPGGGPGGGPGLIAPGLTPGQKPKNPEQPCIDRGKNVRRDLNSIARTVHGKISGVPKLGKSFPGAQINARGQSFGTAVGRLKANGFVLDAVLGVQPPDHPEGENYQKRFNDGLWYHVVVNYPGGASGSIIRPSVDPSQTTPGITAHCHATDPSGWGHIKETIFP
jgi:RHS repeat-associated protein